MKVLLISPQTNLSLADAEVQDLVNTHGLRIETMLGNVTQTDVVRKLRAARGFDVVWLATHGNEDGILLSDGILSSSALTALVRDRFELVYLNTCTSVNAAQMIQNETESTVVCTVMAAPDADAYRTGSLFAAALAESGDYRTAYDKSLPGGNRLYLFLAGKKKV